MALWIPSALTGRENGREFTPDRGQIDGKMER